MINEILMFLGFVDVLLGLLFVWFVLLHWIQSIWLNLYVFPKGSFQRELFFKTAIKVRKEMHKEREKRGG